MLVHPRPVAASARTRGVVTTTLRARRHRAGTRRQLLSSGRPAPMVLTHRLARETYRGPAVPGPGRPAPSGIRVLDG